MYNYHTARLRQTKTQRMKRQEEIRNNFEQRKQRQLPLFLQNYREKVQKFIGDLTATPVAVKNDHKVEWMHVEQYRNVHQTDKFLAGQFRFKSGQDWKSNRVLSDRAGSQLNRQSNQKYLQNMGLDLAYTNRSRASQDQYKSWRPHSFRDKSDAHPFVFRKVIEGTKQTLQQTQRRFDQEERHRIFAGSFLSKSRRSAWERYSQCDGFSPSKSRKLYFKGITQVANKQQLACLGSQDDTARLSQCAKVALRKCNINEN